MRASDNTGEKKKNHHQNNNKKKKNTQTIGFLFSHYLGRLNPLLF